MDSVGLEPFRWGTRTPWVPRGFIPSSLPLGTKEWWGRSGVQKLEEFQSTVQLKRSRGQGSGLQTTYFLPLPSLPPSRGECPLRFPGSNRVGDCRIFFF